ncbi:MAG: AI-2E family transporter [Burkholderiales bacterium]|nr:AI-2E family transporter [Burkholderiales bacterium]
MQKIQDRFLIVLFVISILSVLWLFHDILQVAVVAWLLMMTTRQLAYGIEQKLIKSNTTVLSKNSELISATILTLALILILVIPICTIITYLINNFDYGKIYQGFVNLKANTIGYISSTTWISSNIKNTILTMINDYSNNLVNQGNLKQMWIFGQKYLTNISQIVLDVGLIIALFFLFHLYYKEISKFCMKLIPIETSKQAKIYRNVSGIISIVFHTTLAVAISQGITFGLLMLFFDYNPLMIGAFTAMASVIPIFGSALVWVPIAIIELVNGHIISAVFIIAFGSFVLAFLIDNFARIFFLNQISKYIKVDYKINEFLLFFAMASGITIFGFWGVLIGPAIVALFITLAHTIDN